MCLMSAAVPDQRKVLRMNATDPPLRGFFGVSAERPRTLTTSSNWGTVKPTKKMHFKLRDGSREG